MHHIKSTYGEGLGEMTLSFDITDVIWDTLTHEGVTVLFYLNDDFPIRVQFTGSGRTWNADTDMVETLVDYLEQSYRSLDIGMDLLVEVMDKVWFEGIEEEWSKRVSALPI